MQKLRPLCVPCTWLSNQTFPLVVPVRNRKHFASIHKQDKRIHLFNNASGDYLCIPAGYKLSALSDFCVKKLSGGFQRRPELIKQRNLEGCQMRQKSIVVGDDGPRYRRIQNELLFFAMKILNDMTNKGHTRSTLETDQLIIDIGCGDGSSMKPLVDLGFNCVGVDLDLQSLSNLKYAVDGASSIGSANFTTLFGCVSGQNKTISKAICESPQNCDGHSQMQGLVTEVVRWDLRHGLPFRQNVFDCALSISFLQWLFYGNRKKQLTKFFSSLQSILKHKGCAVLQFYPQNPEQLEVVVKCASSFFHGALIGDYPHLDRGRKLFLLLINDL